MKRAKKTMMLCLLCLLTAANASAQQWIDVTDAFIENPRFDYGDYGWGWWCTYLQNGGYQGATYTNGDCKISRFIELWIDSERYGALGDGCIYQYVELPKGRFRLQADAMATFQSDQMLKPEGVYMFASYLGEEDELLASTPIATKSGKPEHYVATFEMDSNDWVKLGISIENTNCNWVAADNFKLEINSSDYVPLESVELYPTSIVLEPSEMTGIEVEYTPYNATMQKTVFTSSDPSVATVDEWGVVTALKEGKARITAKSKTLEGYIETYCDITVEAIDYVDNTIVINEIQAANVDYFVDPSFNYGSWIELYNPTDKACGLRGLYITDDANDLKKHKLSQLYMAVQPHGFRNIAFDHNGIWNMGEQMQVPFKLKYEGGTIIISDGERILLQQDYPKAIGRTSYARTVDGGNTWAVSATPTPEKSNAGMTFAVEQLPAPVVDTPGQVFSGTLDINVAIPAGAKLHYTTDGTTPTSESSISADGHFTVPRSVTFRFRLFRDGYLPSEVVTCSYIADNSGKPIVSIATNRDNLYDSEIGIFTSGWNGRPGNGADYECNWNMDWDRPANFEYFDETGKCVFEQEVDISVTGGWSRRNHPKSFKIKAAKYYLGQNTLDYQFFDGKPFLKHKALQIRNGGSNNKNQDVALQEIMRRSGLNINTQSAKAVRVYINGTLYGDLNMREPNNKHYGYANYGIDTDEMDQFEMSPDSGYVQMTGTKEAWDKLIELSANAADAATYEEIGKLLDIDEYINYMACEFYIDNWDWPQNNVKGFRDRNDGRFHFVVYDLDEAFNPNKTANFSTFKAKKTYTFDSLRGEHPFGEWSYGDKMRKEIEFVTLFENMLKNETFSRRFVDALCVIGGSTFHPDFAKPVIADVTKEFGSIGSPLSSYLTADRQTDVAKRLKKGAYNFGVDNAKTVKVNISSNIDEGAIYVNDMPVPTGKFVGTLYQPAVLKAITPVGYKFTGWYKLSGQNRTCVSSEAEYEVPSGGITQKFVADFEPLTADELAESGIAPVRVNEVSAGNSIYVNDHFKKDDWVELYNTTDQPIDVAGMYLSDKADNPQKYQIPADAGYTTVIEPRGHLVVWASHRDAVGEQIHTTFKLNNEDGKVVVLTAADGSWSDKLVYAAQDAEETVGRYPDGSNDVYKMSLPTIGRQNALNSRAQWLYTGQPDTNPESIIATGAGIKSTTFYTLGGICVGNTASSLPKGVYIVKYAMADGTVSTRKVAVK